MSPATLIFADGNTLWYKLKVLHVKDCMELLINLQARMPELKRGGDAVASAAS